MSADVQLSPIGCPGAVPRRSLAALALILAAFCLLRLPVLYRHYGGQDEEWYGVPGFTVAQTGIPRIPYAPCRDIKSGFYRVDEALYALSPGYFYWQTPFVLALSAGYGTARLASAVAGLIAICLVYLLGRQLTGRESVGVLAAALYSFSRLFYFPAITARPDVLCAACGLAALWLTSRWQASGSRRTLAASGILLGLGMLTHPFALVFCLQVGGWVLIGGQREGGVKRRLLDFGLLVGCALAVFSLWALLIAAHPDLFRIQFFNNVLNRSGPGLLSRLIFPRESLIYHAEMLLERAQPLQLALMAAGLVGAIGLAFGRGQAGARPLVGLALTGCYLLVTVQGSHPEKGYWCYPGALVFLCVAYAAIKLSDPLVASFKRPLCGRLIGAAVLIGLLLPGAGLRSLQAHLRHWSDPNYIQPRFTQAMLRDLPPDARLLVDPAFVFDVYLAGRNVVLAYDFDSLYSSRGQPYDYLIVGPFGRQYHLAEAMRGRHVRDYGDPDDLFACYAQVYVPAGEE
jgi:hypothetical protein